MLQNITGAVGTTIDVASDPYLSETVCHINQLKAIKQGNTTSYQSCAETPPGLPGGVGLDRLQTPLRAYVYMSAHPWMFPAALVALFGLPFWIGYEMGKK